MSQKTPAGAPRGGKRLPPFQGRPSLAGIARRVEWIRSSMPRGSPVADLRRDGVLHYRGGVIASCGRLGFLFLQLYWRF
jgi:hypothetical protein